MGEYTQNMVAWLMELGVGEKVARDGVEHHEKVLRERIAQDIEVKMREYDRASVGFSAIGDAYAKAARIVREG